MRFAKQLVGLAAVLGVVSIAGRASAFTAPAKITAFLPAANIVTVTKLNSKISGVDQYLCSTGTVLAVTAGTPLASVQKLASSNLAFTKFKAATLTPAQQVNPIQLQLATAWFMNNIGRPYYGL
jgi:hypothetical protein